MSDCLICPVCGKELQAAEREYYCAGGHRFDRAKQGYVNLLQSQRSSQRNHGDDREMILARRDFLEQGFYGPLRELLAEKVYFYTDANGIIVDAGCGEGWYTEPLCADYRVVGFDISKEALKWAAKRKGFTHLAVASCYDLPIKEGVADGLINFFSLLADEAYAKALKKGGILFRAVPGEHHLWQLKEAVYDTPLPNRPEKEDLSGLKLIERCPLSFEIELKGQEQIQALFQMTPYCYRTSPKDREKLKNYVNLKTKAEFTLLIYQKQ
jgi:23S rRNA (guanine745-N1)-methyltransferase